MNQESTTPAGAPPSTAGSSASSLAPASQPLAFRKDTDDGFPVAGAVLLIALMLAAIWAWWYGRVRDGSSLRIPRFVEVLGGRRSPTTSEMHIVETLQAPGGVRLMVVEWSGGRRVLIASSGAHAPVTLDTVQGATGSSGAES